jgi:hypothetical protein
MDSQRIVTGQLQGHINVVDDNIMVLSKGKTADFPLLIPFAMQQNLITSGEQGGVDTVMVFLTAFLVSNKVVSSYPITRLQTRLQFLNKIIVRIYSVRESLQCPGMLGFRPNNKSCGVNPVEV